MFLPRLPTLLPLRAKKSSPGVTHTILGAFVYTTPTQLPPKKPLGEPLTPREKTPTPGKKKTFPPIRPLKNPPFLRNRNINPRISLFFKIRKSPLKRKSP